jgi:hypothetical protein
MKNRNRSLEGDEVAVRLNPESEWKVRETFLCGVGDLCDLKVFNLTL